MDQQWITWALQTVSVFLLGVGWRKLDRNTETITAVKELLLGEYMKKEDFETYRKETREALHEMRNQLQIAERRAP